MAPIAPKQPAPMTDEQRAVAVARALQQKFESVAQGVLYNIIGGEAHADRKIVPEEVTTLALETAALFIKKTPAVVDKLFDEMFNKPVEKKDAEPEVPE